MTNFDKEGCVSIWVGLQPRRKKTDALKVLCGVDCYDVDFQECILSDDGEEVPIRLLLQRFSYAPTFIDEAMKVANGRGITSARWVVAQCEFAYDPAKVRKKIRRIPCFSEFLNGMHQSGRTMVRRN